MAKYMYLPDKNGKISKCGAQDHNNCPYHIGPDGKPLKHYATPEEARAAFEKEQARKHKVERLSKKKGQQRSEGFVPGTSGVDDRFIPSQYRGLSMDEMEHKLDRNIKTEQKKQQRTELERSRVLGKLRNMEVDLGVEFTEDPMDSMNRDILDYKGRVFHVFNDLQKTMDKCDDVQYSRMLLLRLEHAHLGADYGSKDTNDQAVCANAKAYLKNYMDDIGETCSGIKPMQGEDDYDENRADLIDRENRINGIIDNMKNITGTAVDRRHVTMGAITDPNNRTVSDYLVHKENENKQKAMKEHPEYAKLYNQLNGVEARMRMIGKRGEEDSHFKKSLDHLRTMKPINALKEKKARETVIAANPSHETALKRNSRAIAVSDTGDILIETKNEDSMKYGIYDRGGSPVDSVSDYDENYSDKYSKSFLQL